jgi:16S rRNA (cytosine967-C5)-methyltransferase
MNNQGEIVAADIHEHKVNLIRNAADRLGLGCIRPVQGDIRDLLPVLGQFDAVLLDAPCSGFGVIRRKPDIKWRKTPEDVAAIREIQEELILSAADSVKPGGVLVYSTCTIERKENEEIVRTLLRNRTDFHIESVRPYLPDPVRERAMSPEGWVQVLPHHFRTDGFFICRLRKMSATGG